MRYKPELGFFGNLERTFTELTKTNNKVYNNKSEVDQALAENLAETDEMAIELFEANLAQSAINAEQDEAIIEIYEMMEVANNG